MALQEEASSRSPSRADVLARYRRLREIALMHQCKAMAFLSGDAILHHSRRLGGVYSSVTGDNLDGLALPAGPCDLYCSRRQDPRHRPLRQIGAVCSGIR